MGILQDYLKEVRRLKPEDAQPEVLTFYAWILEDGTINYQSPSVRVSPGYMFACEQIKASCPIPPQMNDDSSKNRIWTIAEFLPFISFNVLNEGRQKLSFKNNLPMSIFVNSSGITEGLKFATPITFFEGADISVPWYVDVQSLLLTYFGGQGGADNVSPDPREFNPGQLGGTAPRFEVYAHLIGSIIRAEQIL